MSLIAFDGRLGGDPEIRYTAQGTALANFSVAESHYAGKDDEGKPQYATQWHRVTVWGNLANSLAQRIGKGDLVAVYGEQLAEDYTDKDGNNRQALKIRATRVSSLGGNRRADEDAEPAAAGSRSNGKARNAAAAALAGGDGDLEDLPF